MKRKTKKKLIQAGVALSVIAVAILVIYFITRTWPIYDYQPLIDHVDYGPATEFAPLAAETKPDGMPNAVKAAESDTLVLYVDEVTCNVAVTDKRNQTTWYAAPADVASDPIANPMEKNLMQSPLVLQYFTATRLKSTMLSYDKAVLNGQVVLKSIPNGVRVEYTIGDTSLGINAAPMYLTAERLEEKILSQLEDESEVKWVRQRYVASKEKEGFLQLLGSVVNSKIHSAHLLEILSTVGYTLDDLAEDNETAGYEMDLTFNYFFIPVHYVLSGSKLIASIHTDEIVCSGDTTIGTLDFMRFFGAGGPDEEGYLMIPDGSGALINFNNGKQSEEMYIGTVYSQDYLMYWTFPQVTQTIRMPVYGIKRDNAAFFAEILHGSAISTIYADVSGRTNSYNNVYASFTLRENEMLNVAGITGADSDMTVVQANPYSGNITIQYSFLANEEASYAGMANAYQQDLVDRGTLRPLDSAENVPFYLDVLGAIEKESYLLGIPYYAKVPMTTYQQAQSIVSELAAQNVGHVQMQWLGWFNGGINHHLPKVVNPIGSIGGKKDRSALIDTLSATGGNLYPAVKFISAVYESKNMNQMHEMAKSVAGYMGFYTGYNREFLRTSRTRFWSDVYQLVHPGMMPKIIDQFLTQYEKQDLDTISLQDMGDNLTSSLHRINSVDRESSKMIMSDQMRKLNEDIGDMMVVGGNDYSWAYTQNMVDVPTGADRYYIVDESIPFMQMVLHGYVDYAGTPVNSNDAYNPDDQFLTMLEYGASPHYVWTYQPTVMMERTPYDRYYSTQYTDWINQAVTFYQQYNNVYKNLRTQQMTDYVLYADGVSATVFEDGTRVYVNKTNKAVSVSGPDGAVQIAAKGYFVTGVGTR